MTGQAIRLSGSLMAGTFCQDINFALQNGAFFGIAVAQVIPFKAFILSIEIVCDAA